MANPFRWGKSNDGPKDVFSASFFASKPAPNVSEEQALSIPAVKAAVELISNSIAQLPIYLYVENEADESVEKMESDSRVNLLNHSANKYDAGQVLKKRIVVDYLLRGKAYLYRKEDGTLYVLPAKNVLEEYYTTDYISIAQKTYIYQGMETLNLNDDEVFEINSGTNGLLYDNGQLLSIALGQLEYSQSLLDNSAVPTGILKSASRLTETAISRLRDSWSTLYTGTKKSGKTIILEEGLDYSQLGLSPDKMQMVESQKSIVSEIARIFNIPESLINSHANKYASLEQNNIQFLQGTLSPIITSIESYLDKNLLTEEEKSLGFYFRFSTEEILRTTEKEKVETVQAALTGGLISFNEARRKLDLSKIEKDYYLLSLGSVLKDAETGELTIPNMGVTTSNENGNTKQPNNTNQ